MQKQFLNPETDTFELYTEKWMLEKVTVKEIDDLIVNNHYWQDSDGELWVDFDDPNENLHHAFDAYRRRKGFMSSEELRNLRKDVKLSVRDFASHLGISSSIVSQIENNQRVQVKYQDILFKDAKDKFQRLGYLPNVDNHGQDVIDEISLDLNQSHTQTIELTYRTNISNQQAVFGLSRTPKLGDAA